MFSVGLFEATIFSIRLGTGAVRPYPAYNVSQDGFARLAMGFTRKQTLAFKLAYITAFNAMEPTLRKLHVTPLASDKEFTRGIRMEVELVLHHQAAKAVRPLCEATFDDCRC